MSNERGGRTNVEILIMQTQKHEHTKKASVYIDHHLHTEEHIRAETDLRARRRLIEMALCYF